MSAIQSNCSEAERGHTSQSNNGGSTGHSECDRNQVGSKGEASGIQKMEIKQEEGKGDREATKEKGTRFATHAEVPVQGLEVEQALRSPHETIESMNSTRNLNEDLEGITPRILRDQDQEYGVQPKTTGPQPKEDEDEDEDDEDEDDEGQEKCDVHIAAERALKRKEKTVRGLDRQGDRIKRGGTADAIAEATVAEDAVDGETMAKDAVDETIDAADADADVTMDAVAAGMTAAAAETAASSAIDSARNAAARRTTDVNMCSVVVLTSDMPGIPDADGDGTEGAEALYPHTSAGNAAYAASARRQMVDAEPYRGGLTCVLQPGAGTRSTHNISTSAPKSDTHLPAMNGTPLTTGLDSVVPAASTDGDRCDGVAADAGGGVTVTQLDGQKGDTQPPGTDSSATHTGTDLYEGGGVGVDVNGGVDVSGDAVEAAVTDLDDLQQYHGEKSCVTAPVVSRLATLNGAVGIVACATGYNTLSDGTPVAMQMNGWQVQQQLAAAKDASTGPMETGDVPAGSLFECCMNAVLNVPIREQTKDAANGVDGREDEEVTHQLRLAGTPGEFTDLVRSDTVATMQTDDAAEPVAAMQTDDAAEPVASMQTDDAAVATVAAVQTDDAAVATVATMQADDAAVATVAAAQADDAAVATVAAVSVFQVDPDNNGMGSLPKQESVAEANERLKRQEQARRLQLSNSTWRPSGT